MLDVLAQPAVRIPSLFGGAALAAADAAANGGLDMVGLAALIASGTGLLGTAYTIYRGVREDARRDRRK